MPFILWFSLPSSCDNIIDFVREHTVNVDGIGYVCSYAVFDDILQNNTDNGTLNDLKMEQSILGFKASYPDWSSKGNHSRRQPGILETRKRHQFGGNQVKSHNLG